MDSQQHHDPQAPQEAVRDGGRRTFCQVGIGCLAAVSGAMLGFPLVSFLARPQTLDLDKPLEIPLEGLPAGQAQYVEYRGAQLIVLANSDGPVVFSASCPHLGCNVMWDAADALFRCPCHGAVFKASGDVVSGPVSTSLHRVPFEVKDGKMIISSEV